LRLSPNCSKADIKKARAKYASLFHPDKYTGKSEEEKRANRERINDINKAFDMLIDDKARKRYKDAYLYMPFQCPGCLVSGVSRNNGIRSKSSLRYFHSGTCAAA